MIARLQTQKHYIEHAARALAGIEGMVLEIGLGKGRTFDHLRRQFPERAIVAFDRDVYALPHCVPDRRRLVLGEFQDTLPAWLSQNRTPIALVHADIGSRDPSLDAHLARWLCERLRGQIRSGGWLLCDRPMPVPDMEPQDLQAVSATAWPYYAYRAR